MVRALILGGTSDANLLATAVAAAGLDAIYSYAGRTQMPVNQPLPVRTGGFGGANGLAAYVRREKITHVIDASHPFAAGISGNAVTACAVTKTPLIALERPPWRKKPGDRWIEVPNIESAVAALPSEPTRVFLAIGRQHIAPFGARPQHSYTMRFVDVPDEAVPLAGADVIVSRGPFSLQGELALMRKRRIELVVSRNSGGTGAYAKIDAARELGLPVIMIARPELPERPRTENIGDVMRWLDHRTHLGA